MFITRHFFCKIISFRLYIKKKKFDITLKNTDTAYFRSSFSLIRKVCESCMCWHDLRFGPHPPFRARLHLNYVYWHFFLQTNRIKKTTALREEIMTSCPECFTYSIKHYWEIEQIFSNHQASMACVYSQRAPPAGSNYDNMKYEATLSKLVQCRWLFASSSKYKVSQTTGTTPWGFAIHKAQQRIIII